MDLRTSQQQRFAELLGSRSINVSRLRDEAFSGCPETGSFRSIIWRILLGLLGDNKETWAEHLRMMRALYQQYVHEMIILPDLSRQEETSDNDHPLSSNPNSQWKKHFEDNETLHQIDKDCRRLCPDLNFFQQASPVPSKPHVSLKSRVEIFLLDSEEVAKDRRGFTSKTAKLKKRRDSDMYRLEEGQEAHWEVCERILFLYTKLNPGQGYVQGMNEVLGPIYFVLASDADREWSLHAESDAFFCFTSLMSEIRDHFIKELDSTQSGIQGRMRDYQIRLRQLDQSLHEDLTKKGLKSEFYVFRWLTLLLSQEYRLPDLLRIWDSLLSDKRRFDFLLDICCSMVTLIRSELLSSDFSECMRLLQNYPYNDVRPILTRANEYYMRRYSIDFNQHEATYNEKTNTAVSTPDSDLFAEDGNDALFEVL